jgi:hypothetical protein
VELLSIDIDEHKRKAEDLYETTCELCTDAEFVQQDNDFETVFASLKKM